MLNSCGHALSQGDVSDFNPWHNWGATPPGYSAYMRAWIWLTPHHWATPAQTYYGSQESWENTGMLAGVTDYGRSQKCGCRGRLVLGFKPRCSSHVGQSHAALTRSESHRALGILLPRSLGSQKARCSSDADLSLSSLAECRRCCGKEGGSIR